MSRRKPRLPIGASLVAGETNRLDFLMAELVEVSGSVIAQDTGAPFSGINVRIGYDTNYMQSTSVTTDSNGRFTARVLPGYVSLQLMNLGETNFLQSEQLEREYVPNVPDGNELKPVKLVRASPLDGQLVDRSGAPVADARVWAYYNDSYCSTAETDNDGRFKLPKFPESVAAADGDYQVQLGIDPTTPRTRPGEVGIVGTSPLILEVKR